MAISQLVLHGELHEARSHLGTLLDDELAVGLACSSNGCTVKGAQIDLTYTPIHLAVGLQEGCVYMHMHIK